VQDAVRTATTDDLPAVVSALTAAFVDDPLMSWAFPDEEVRPRRLDAMWTFFADEAYLPRGASTVVGGGGGRPADAAALWLAPGEDLDGPFWEVRGHAFASALDHDLERLSSLSELMAVHHPQEAHWYLLAIGVPPHRQGGRLGSALLSHTLALADEDGAPAYLEATSARSRALYERHGFVATADFAAPGGPTVWPMWREPT
jgi:GNAT superfamily N-acetyltransferase